jgi:hypothetical protein
MKIIFPQAFRKPEWPAPTHAVPARYVDHSVAPTRPASAFVGCRVPSHRATSGAGLEGPARVSPDTRGTPSRPVTRAASPQPGVLVRRQAKRSFGSRDALDRLLAATKATWRPPGSQSAGTVRTSSAKPPPMPSLWEPALASPGTGMPGVTVEHRSRVAADPTQPNLRQVHLIHTELRTLPRRPRHRLRPVPRRPNRIDQAQTPDESRNPSHVSRGRPARPGWCPVRASARRR